MQIAQGTALYAAEQIAAVSRIGRALADPTRARLLLAMLDGPAYPAKLAEQFGLTRSNVSNHLSCLRGCGLVTATAEGRQTRYDLVDPHLTHALRDLLDVALASDPAHECEPSAMPAVRPGTVHEPAIGVRRPGQAHQPGAALTRERD